MISCPNCGSTAQIKCIYTDGEAPTEEKYVAYRCGCGCSFLVTYKAIEVQAVKVKL